MTTTMTPAPHVHRQVVEASVKEIAGRLQELLTRRLTAYIAGVDSGTVGERPGHRDPQSGNRTALADRL